MSDVVANVGDIHHIFPRAYLREAIDAPQRLYNQVANYTYLEKKINIAIGKQNPGEYFSAAKHSCENGESYFGDITSLDELHANLAANCIPEDIFEMDASDYERFLDERRVLMAQKIKKYFFSL